MIPASAPHAPSQAASTGEPTARRSAPPTSLLDRPEFAVLPWIVLAVCLVAGALSEWLRGEAAGRDWVAIYGALIGAVAATGLAVAQHLTAVRRPRSSALLYGAGTGLVLVGLAGMAISIDGLLTPYYAGMLPLATYLGMIAARRAQPWLLGTLFAITATVQLFNAQAELWEAAVVWSLILAGWACGVLTGLEHDRVARIARRLADYDRATRSLNRRAFLEHVDRALAAPEHELRPIAVLLVDLTSFAAINAKRGYAGGDAVLEQVGATFAAVLPDDAELGRLGDDRFAVLLPRSARNEAEAVGHRIRSFLHADIDAAVGIATCQLRSLSLDDLMRVAEAALRVCKQEGVGLHVLVGGSTSTARALRALPTGPGPLSYRRVRSTGKVPRAVGTLALYSWVSTAAYGVVLCCGAVVVAAAWAGTGDGFALELVRYGGFAWLLWVAVLIGLSRIPAYSRPELRGWFLLANGTASVTIGICCASLAHGGLIAPLASALCVKVLFDAATLPATAARINVLAVLLGWGAFAALSPAETHYLIPFQAALLCGCFVLGSMCQRANGEMAAHARAVGYVDDLTALTNRAGFSEDAEAEFLDAVTRTGAPYALLSFRVDDPARRPAASLLDRDRMLRQTADTLVAALPDAYVVARTGELEFMAAIPRAGHAAAAAAAGLIADQVGPLAVTYAGVAACPDDGATFEALTRAANGLPPLALHRPESGPLAPTGRYPGGPRADRRLAQA